MRAIDILAQDWMQNGAMRDTNAMSAMLEFDERLRRIEHKRSLYTRIVTQDPRCRMYFSGNLLSVADHGQWRQVAFEGDQGCITNMTVAEIDEAHRKAKPLKDFDEFHVIEDAPPAAAGPQGTQLDRP